MFARIKRAMQVTHMQAQLSKPLADRTPAELEWARKLFFRTLNNAQLPAEQRQTINDEYQAVVNEIRWRAGDRSI